MEKSKAQIMTMETIAVLLVFFIILAFVLLFYYGFQSSRIEEQRRELSEEQAVQIAQHIASLPELECTGGGIETGVDCFDLYKIQAMSKEISENEVLRLGIYQEKFGTSSITFTQIYDRGQMTNNTWVVYDRAPSSPGNQYSFQTLVSLNDPTINPPLGVRKVALLEVIYYG
ncbi:hypothetical protein KY316_01965 [Candidatus Woesearchaeota archaeon]|nr:hypothetical protein [Candidatus Woesearchaeota archaeon]